MAGKGKEQAVAATARRTAAMILRPVGQVAGSPGCAGCYIARPELSGEVAQTRYDRTRVRHFFRHIGEVA